MGHPKIDNTTRFAVAPVFIADETLRPVVVVVVKATFAFGHNGAVELVEEQVPVNLGGEPWSDEPISSQKYEPEVALLKLATDVALVGHARPPTVNATEVDVGIKVGPVRKVARVFGDRYWMLVNGEARRSRTGPFAVPIPLAWERSFGGRDELHSTPEKVSLEPRNPVGTGFGRPLSKEQEVLKLPNIEDPANLISAYGQTVTPCGFGFISPNWEPRASFAGTYDARWDASRKPLLPLDFDRRFFNAAAPGLVAPGYLRGDEEVVVMNTTAAERLAFRLPGVQPPRCRVVLRGPRDTELAMNLDTVIVNTDEQRLFLLWRAFTFVGSGPHDVVAIAVTG
jgi:hypothetical protein